VNRASSDWLAFVTRSLVRQEREATPGGTDER
jgi:hypothetical protein